MSNVSYDLFNIRREEMLFEQLMDEMYKNPATAPITPAEKIQRMRDFLRSYAAGLDTRSDAWARAVLWLDKIETVKNALIAKERREAVFRNPVKANRQIG